jgi:hypothetical protein
VRIPKGGTLNVRQENKPTSVFAGFRDQVLKSPSPPVLQKPLHTLTNSLHAKLACRVMATHCAAGL